MRYLIFLPLLICGRSPLEGSVISLQSQVKNTVRGETLETTITVTNRGDETALNIQITAKSPQSSKQSAVLPDLPVGKSHSETSTFSLAGLNPGLYPLIVNIGYTDANLYPFSALAISPITYKTGSAPSILGLLGNAKVRQSGRLDLKVKNLENQNRHLTIQLLTPRELSAENPLTTLDLSPGAESKVSFVVRNFAALKGSTYAVYATMEYEENGIHFTALAPGTLTIEPPGPLASLQHSLGPALLFLLALGALIGGRIYWERRKVTAKPSSPGIRR